MLKESLNLSHQQHLKSPSSMVKSSHSNFRMKISPQIKKKIFDEDRDEGEDENSFELSLLQTDKPSKKVTYARDQVY